MKKIPRRLFALAVCLFNLQAEFICLCEDIPDNNDNGFRFRPEMQIGEEGIAACGNGGVYPVQMIYQAAQ
jgi:hypothetical protein